MQKLNLPHQAAQALTSLSPVSVKQMQAIDFTAIVKLGIPRLLLMDHAGLAVSRSVVKLLKSPKEGVLIVCGRGYNGGDGLSAARHLAGLGLTVRVMLLSGSRPLRAEPAVFAKHLRALGVPIEGVGSRSQRVLQKRIRQASVLVDALLGVGAQGPLRAPVDAIIEIMNESRKPIVAVDIPSGLDADTGEAAGGAIMAKLTVTFGRIKRGCTLKAGPRRAGKIILERITIPKQLLIKI